MKIIVYIGLGLAAVVVASRLLSGDNTGPTEPAPPKGKGLPTSLEDAARRALDFLWEGLTSAPGIGTIESQCAATHGGTIKPQYAGRSQFTNDPSFASYGYNPPAPGTRQFAEYWDCVRRRGASAGSVLVRDHRR